MSFAAQSQFYQSNENLNNITNMQDLYNKLQQQQNNLVNQMSSQNCNFVQNSTHQNFLENFQNFQHQNQQQMQIDLDPRMLLAAQMMLQQQSQSTNNNHNNLQAHNYYQLNHNNSNNNNLQMCPPDLTEAIVKHQYQVMQENKLVIQQLQNLSVASSLNNSHRPSFEVQSSNSGNNVNQFNYQAKQQMGQQHRVKKVKTTGYQANKNRTDCLLSSTPIPLDVGYRPASVPFMRNSNSKLHKFQNGQNSQNGQNNAPAVVSTPLIVTHQTPVHKQQIPPAISFLSPEQQFKKLVETLENLFSDTYLLKSSYLLKQILRTKNQWISIKFIASIKVIKKLLTKENQEYIVKAIAECTTLEMNEEKSKVRRIVLVRTDLNANVKKNMNTSLLALKVPHRYSTVEGVQRLFGIYGEIVQMRIILPKGKIPNYLRGYATHIPELGLEICVIVEYATNEQAKLARNNVNTPESLRDMKVAILGPKIKRNLYKNEWGNKEILMDEKEKEVKPKTNSSSPNNSSTCSPTSLSNTSSSEELESDAPSNIDSGVYSRNKNTNLVKHALLNYEKKKMEKRAMIGGQGQ